VQVPDSSHDDILMVTVARQFVIADREIQPRYEGVRSLDPNPCIISKVGMPCEAALMKALSPNVLLRGMFGCCHMSLLKS
jgi:hypothetical protein